jgi:hypothetical protein
MSLFKSLNNLRHKTLQQINDKKALKQWELKGRPNPSPQPYKHLTIKKYAEEYNVPILIETGTFHGDTIYATMSSFRKVFSIELSDELYKLALIRFKKDKKVTILHGDSGQVIEGMLKEITEKCLFWLDGHYSAGNTAKGDLNTPIIKELIHILNHKVKGHVMLIDDARCFNGTDDYPTIEYLKDFVKQYDPRLQFFVEDDIIRIHK